MNWSFMQLFNCEGDFIKKMDKEILQMKENLEKKYLDLENQIKND